jgi:nucleolar GTP-binding protein
MDFKFLRWQVIDSPGILDHPLEERNTIEMQSVTAMAHIRAAVLFFIDISEQCGYSVKEQVGLFSSIRPLFANKPLIVVLNKIDVVRPENLDAEIKAELALFEREGVRVCTMSTLMEEGVSQVKETACDMLLEHRVEAKLRGRQAEAIVARLFVAEPKKRDDKERPITIPPAVLKRREAERKKAEREAERRAAASMSDDAGSGENSDDDDDDGDYPRRPKTLERDLEVAGGGAGVYDVDMRKHYTLANPDWVYDVVPEILDGKNIADYIDPDIWARLEALEKEEAELEAQWGPGGEAVAWTFLVFWFFFGFFGFFCFFSTSTTYTIPSQPRAHTEIQSPIQSSCSPFLFLFYFFSPG